MGIKDLLRFMKPYIEPVHIKKYAGKRVGIDAYSWLHKGAYSCSMDIHLNSDGEKKLQYLNYFMHRINLLRHYDITPVVVFDGGNNPCKGATEQERHRKRTANRDMAMRKLKEGDVQAASQLFQKVALLFALSALFLPSNSPPSFKKSFSTPCRAVSITPAMAYQLIQVLRSEDIEFVVAPYEADAQLAYLCSLEAEKGGIAAVITEDSDLLAYCCQAVIFKMDRYGNGEEILLEKVFKSEACMPSFQKFNRELFTGMCVLAGCDFLPSVPGIGIVKAYSLVSKYCNLDRVLSVLKIEKGSQMPEDYSKSFRQAVAVFQHARIYDAGNKKLEHMRPLPQELLQSLDGELDFLGPDIPPSIATAIAEGNLDPINMEAFDRFPKPECNLNRNHKTGKLQKLNVIDTPTKESCFMVFASQATSGKEKKESKKNLDEKKCPKEDMALEKLIVPSELRSTVEVATTNDTQLRFPDNNPFKKREIGNTHLDHKVSLSAVTDTEKKKDILCMTPGRMRIQVPENNPFRKETVGKICLDETMGVFERISVANEAESSDVFCVNLNNIPSKVHEKSPTRKRKVDEIYLDLTGVSEQISLHAGVESQELLCLTPGRNPVSRETENRSHHHLIDIAAEQDPLAIDVESSNVLCATMVSQERVNTKPGKISERKTTGKKESSRRVTSNNSGNKKSSILNYFSRVS